LIVSEKVLDEKNSEFEIGRRHLARIMGEDPEGFNQEKIDVCQWLNDIYFFTI
jgi:hypothetical protein